MKTTLLALVLALPALAGDTRTTRVGESDRTWRLHVPKAFEKGKALPLVIALHGAMSTGEQMEQLTGFSELAEKKSFVVAYPDGTNRLWRYGDVGGGGKEDVAFLGAIIDELVGEGTVDPKRVYATGISNGAYMSHKLACSMSDRIAAIAPVAGTMLEMMMKGMKPKRAVPVVAFHGTEDTVVGYDGTDMFSKRAMSMSAEAMCAWWAEKNGCDKEATVESMPDKADDGTTVERRTWKGPAPVVFYRIEGGGHTWPGMPPVAERLLGRTSKDISASEIIWAFFEKHALPEK